MTGRSAKSRAKAMHLIGGGPNMVRGKGADPLLEAAFAEAGKAEPSIAYVGAASDDDRGFFRWLGDLFRRSGSGEVRLVPLASRRADPAVARELLSNSDMVFVSGGDVEVGMAHLERHGLAPHLHDLFRRGTPFFGVSAGSIMLARCWVRWTDPDDDASAEPFPCLGMAPVVCDTHAEDDDWSELRALLALTEDGVGFGIPSAAALRVAPNGAVSAVGAPVHHLQRRGGGVERVADLVPGARAAAARARAQQPAR